MWTVLPVMTGPDLPIDEETITPMNVGMVGGGPELFPGEVVQVVPHAGVAALSSKPLKAGGAFPPLSGLSLSHCAPQKVTLVPMAVPTPSPITNEPPVANAKISVAAASEDGR